MKRLLTIGIILLFIGMSISSSTGFDVERLNEPPETPSKPYGPLYGKWYTEHEFITNTEDPDGDDVYYLFDWGDGEDSGWVGPYRSGKKGNASHSWEDTGYYYVKVKAKDSYSESGWSPEHNISIFGGVILDIGVIQGGLWEVKTVIKNIGSGQEATDIEWRINCRGFLFGWTQTWGIIWRLPWNAEEAIRSMFIAGFGPITVTVKAWCYDWTAKRVQTGFIFIGFIKMNPDSGESNE